EHALLHPFRQPGPEQGPDERAEQDGAHVDEGAGHMDVLVVALGSTTGLRRAEDALAASLERAGASVAVARAAEQPDVRTLAYTDLRWALAARSAARAALRRDQPRAILYYTTTAALLWPRPGAVRFDSLAADSRPGRHGVW